jgi:Zn-dependent protease with chaperone function
MLIFHPSTSIIQTVAPTQTTTAIALNGVFFWGMPPLPPSAMFIITQSVTQITVLSVTGVLCYLGLIAGGLFALSMLAADDRIARRVLNVILLSPGEHPWLQTKVADLSKKLVITTPKIGLVEDLRPNAFTVGYGENTTIVFSIGLLNTLNEEEVVAVASHELAHVKNHDFLIKTFSSALTVVSFFNPLAYIASSASQREREMLADEGAVKLLEKPAALGNALVKISNAIQTFPKQSALVSFSSNLLMASSVLHRVGILSTHPRLDTRLRNISGPKPKLRNRLNFRNLGLAFILTTLLVCSAVAVSFAMVNLQTGFVSAQQMKTLPLDFKGTSYVIVVPSSASPYMHAPNINPQSINEWAKPPYPPMNNGTVIFVYNNSSFIDPNVYQVKVYC